MIQLEQQGIVDAMTAELEKHAVRYNKESLDHYVTMKIPMTRAGVTPMKPYKWHTEPKTTITQGTLLNWVKIFIEKYN